MELTSDPPTHKATADKRVTSDEIAGDTPAATGNAELRYSSKRDGCATLEISMHRNRLTMTAASLATYMSSSRAALDDCRRVAVAREKDMFSSAREDLQGNRTLDG